MDKDLVLRVQTGDSAAFESLMIANHHRLFRAAYGILRDAHLAEDATQQTFLDIWRDVRGLRDPAKFEGWSYRLLVRVCYAEAKRKSRWLPAIERLPAEPFADDAFGIVIDRDQLERGFEWLSVDHRTVIVLHHLLDMTLDKVAETLDVPLGTVHSRLNRAMAALRDAMTDEARTTMTVAVPKEAAR